MTDTRHDEFVAKHTEVLNLRKRAEDLRYQLQLVEGRLQGLERESSVMFHNLFNAKVVEPQKPIVTRTADERGWHYDSQGYCDNPGRGY